MYSYSSFLYKFLKLILIINNENIKLYSNKTKNYIESIILLKILLGLIECVTRL